MVALYEQFRPRLLDDVVGQDKAVSACRRIMARGVGGNAVWLTGPSGSGKTTLARILADSLQGRVIEYRAADELTAGEIENIDTLYRVNTRGLFQMPTAVIVNEAHGLSARQVRALLGLLEPIPQAVLWVFTTTWDGQGFLEENAIDAAPLMSRCWGGAPIRLTNQGFTPAIAGYVAKCAAVAGMDGLPLEDYVAAAKRCKGNGRALFQAVEAGTIGGAQ